MVFDTVAPPATPPDGPLKRPAAPVLPIPRPPRPPATSPGPAGSVGSCDVRPAQTYCFAYTGLAWTAISAAANCASAPRATFSAAPCPTADRIATCAYSRDSDPDRGLVYTTYAPADLDLARLACPGTFTVIDEAATSR